MSLLTTELSRERVEFLLHSSWPANMDNVDDWLRNAPKGRFCTPAASSLITPVTVNTHDGQASSFSWFANYPDPARLMEAHDDLGGLISAVLGVPGIQERGHDPSGYWLTPKFAIETYAHDASEREGSRQLVPTLQVNVADAALAASKEARARWAG